MTLSGSCQYANSTCPKLKCQDVMSFESEFLFLSTKTFEKLMWRVGIADKEGSSWGLGLKDYLPSLHHLQFSVHEYKIHFSGER